MLLGVLTKEQRFVTYILATSLLAISHLYSIAQISFFASCFLRYFFQDMCVLVHAIKKHIASRSFVKQLFPDNKINRN